MVGGGAYRWREIIRSRKAKVQDLGSGNISGPFHIRRREIDQ